MKTLGLIKEQQRNWAKKNNIVVDSRGYVKEDRIEKDNLFEPFLADARNEFLAGGGKELSGKMRALHSSSALVCNVFHYWRSRQKVSVVAKALGLNENYQNLKFEMSHGKPPEIGGQKPHLDVEITNVGLTPLAIESKFNEPYGVRSVKNFDDKYKGNSHVWQPLKACQNLVDKIIDGKELFYRLDAPQLLKHVMGLKQDYKSNFKLCYLWYEVSGKEADEHNDEIKRFMSLIERDINFHVITYQELFPKIKALSGVEDSAYINYLKERYFS